MQNSDDRLASSLVGSSYIRSIKVVRRRVEEELLGTDRFGLKALKEFKKPDGSCDEHVLSKPNPIVCATLLIIKD